MLSSVIGLFVALSLSLTGYATKRDDASNCEQALTEESVAPVIVAPEEERQLLADSADDLDALLDPYYSLTPSRTRAVQHLLEKLVESAYTGDSSALLRLFGAGVGVRERGIFHFDNFHLIIDGLPWDETPSGMNALAAELIDKNMFERLCEAGPKIKKQGYDRIIWHKLISSIIQYSPKVNPEWRAIASRAGISQ